MKILYLIAGSNSENVNTHIRMLLQGLCQTDTVRLICLEEGLVPEQARSLGADTRVLDPDAEPNTLKLLADMIAQDRFQIVHCMGSRADALGARLQQVTSVPVLTTVFREWRRNLPGKFWQKLSALFRPAPIRWRVGISADVADSLIIHRADPYFTFSLCDIHNQELSPEAARSRQKQIYEIILRRSRRPKKKRDGVLICGAYGKGNAGDDSILTTILMQMRNLDRDIPIHVLSRCPMETRLRYRVDSIHIFDILHYLPCMRSTSLYINGGGSLIQDITSSRSLYNYLANIALAKLCGNPVVMYGCGIGPVFSPKNRKLAGRIIDRCVDRITFRDPQSARDLQSMGVSRPEMQITADPALLLEPASDASVDAYFLCHSMDPAQKYALFVLRPWQEVEAVCTSVAATAEQLYAEKGFIPVFLALEPGRDLPVSQLTAAQMKCPNYILAAPTDGALLVGLMRKMEIVVSMRLHALIFAAGQGIPIVGLVYDPKVSGFLDYLGKQLYTDLSHATRETLYSMIGQALAQGRDPTGAQKLRLLAAENQQAAARYLSGQAQ